MDNTLTAVRRSALAVIATSTLIPVSPAQSGGDFNLDKLPHYEPSQPVSGTIRNFGADFGGLLALWEEGFRKSQDRSYPLVRNIYLYLNRPPAQALDPKLKEFLRYVLSGEGQELVAANGNYLPLTVEIAREQLAKPQ